MSELLSAFDAYKDFAKTSYFTLCYNSLASNLSLLTPLASTKKNTDEVLAILDLKPDAYELVFKNWNTEDASNSDFSKDFAYQQLYKGLQSECIIWINCDNDMLEIDFLYNCTDVALEQWVVECNHLIRTKFGLERTATFNVLTRSHNSFDVSEVRTEDITIDVESLYNDDFKVVDDKIKKSVVAQQSGLILLYGTPGTGKTTYIKSLISEFKESNFIFVQNEFVQNLLDPDFIAFLLQQRNAILIIEDAEKVITSREHQNQGSVVSTILQLTDGLFSDYLNIKVICTFNSGISKIDSALLRKGRMIAMYEFKPLSVEKSNQLLSSVGVSGKDKEMTIADIFNHQDADFDNVSIGGKKIGF